MGVVWLGLWLGCAGTGEVRIPDEPVPEEPGEVPSEPADPAVTYYADVQPLLAASCARCHGPDGLPPGDFTEPDVAVAWAEVMSFRIASGEMPPRPRTPTATRTRGRTG